MLWVGFPKQVIQKEERGIILVGTSNDMMVSAGKTEVLLQFCCNIPGCLLDSLEYFLMASSGL